MLTRNKIYTKKELEKDSKKIYIFCEGEKKEIDYFKFFQGFSSNIDIIPIPNKEGQSDPEKLMENAQLQLDGTATEKPKLNFNLELGDEVWFAIDTDRWNEDGKIEKLKTFCLEKINWFVSQSNPAFELWLYFHFHDMKPKIEEIENFTSFKNFVHNKLNGGFDNRKHPLLFQIAIDNSEKNFELLENNQPQYLSTELFKLAKSILPFIKESIDTCLKAQFKS